jgi:hypothetical protein
LSVRANPDGTFINGRDYSPSLKTLLKHVNKAAYYRLTQDLQDLGLLSWTRQNHYTQRSYVIHLPKQVPDTPETPGSRLDDETPNQVPVTINQVPVTPITGSNGVNHPSCPSEEPTKTRTVRTLTPGEDSKPKASDKKDIKSLVDYVLQELYLIGEGRLRLSMKHVALVTEAITEHLPTRDALSKVIHKLAGQMTDDEMKFGGAGQFALNLGPALSAEVVQAARDKQQELDIARSIEAGLAQSALECAQRLAAIEEEERIADASKPF